ncbi:MAG: glycosyltransferase [Gemmatimonadetes bacterium]|nr:glycosyltransferase [Gemmatimonadota bacterium]
MKLSVSVITYNHEPYIARAIEGILMQQTDFDYEIVIGEDCSTDRTREIVLDYQMRYPERIRTIIPERNLGQAGLRILVETLRELRGEYIARMDGDDYWTSPYKLQRQVEFLDSHPDCSLCFHNVLHIYEDGSPPHNRFAPGRQQFTTTRDILRSCYIPGCSPMFRREVVAELPSWFFDVLWADWGLYTIAAEQGKLGYLDEVMGVYRIHATGVWSSRPRLDQLEGVIDFYQKVNRGTQYRYADVIAHGLSRFYSALAATYLEQDDHRQARDAAWKALRSEPLGRHFRRTDLLRVLAASYVAPARKWLRHRRLRRT